MLLQGNKYYNMDTIFFAKRFLLIILINTVSFTARAEMSEKLLEDIHHLAKNQNDRSGFQGNTNRFPSKQSELDELPDAKLPVTYQLPSSNEQTVRENTPHNKDDTRSDLNILNDPHIKNKQSMNKNHKVESDNFDNHGAILKKEKVYHIKYQKPKSTKKGEARDKVEENVKDIPHINEDSKTDISNEQERLDKKVDGHHIEVESRKHENEEHLTGNNIHGGDKSSSQLFKEGNKEDENKGKSEEIPVELNKHTGLLSDKSSNNRPFEEEIIKSDKGDTDEENTVIEKEGLNIEIADRHQIIEESNKGVENNKEGDEKVESIKEAKSEKEITEVENKEDTKHKSDIQEQNRLTLPRITANINKNIEIENNKTASHNDESENFHRKVEINEITFEKHSKYPKPKYPKPQSSDLSHQSNSNINNHSHYLVNKEGDAVNETDTAPKDKTAGMKVNKHQHVDKRRTTSSTKESVTSNQVTKQRSNDGLSKTSNNLLETTLLTRGTRESKTKDIQVESFHTKQKTKARRTTLARVLDENNQQLSFENDRRDENPTSGTSTVSSTAKTTQKKWKILTKSSFESGSRHPINENNLAESGHSDVRMPDDQDRNACDNSKMYSGSALVAATVGGVFIGAFAVFALFHLRHKCKTYINGDYRRVPMEYDFELNPRFKTH